jgi:4-alpha-glucanotransferase
MKKRGSGILCHITSLPSSHGIGDLGPGAYAFADFLCAAKQSYWQILPLNPTNERYAYSPFTSMSSCAGNTLLISPEALTRDGLLSQADLLDRPAFSQDRVDYAGSARYKRHLFNRAFAKFQEGRATDHDYHRFCRGEAGWLEEHALFTALSEHLGRIPLVEWPKELRDGRSPAVEKLQETLAEAVEREKFLQYVFYRQWLSLKNYCNAKGIQIIGDFPLFMSYDSADIWARPEIFKVDENKKPSVVAGSPPDNFSAQGQLFNCALYDWDVLKASGFDWWIRRFHYLFKLFDFVRIDHFRGLISYWEVSATEQSAVNGTWKPAAVQDFIPALLGYFPTLPVIAEDLGNITAEVREAMAIYGIPGMKVMVLAFQNGRTEDAYLPHNYPRNCVVYTGTHDTNTIMGWLKKDNLKDRKGLADYLGREIGEGVNWELMQLALMSVADTVVMQMQDLLSGGEETRMNTPGKAEGNWLWRLPTLSLDSEAARLAEMTLKYGRAR